METLPKCESSPSEILCVDPDAFCGEIAAIILFNWKIREFENAVIGFSNLRNPGKERIDSPE